MRINLLVLRAEDIHALIPFYEAILYTKADIHRHGNGPEHAAFTMSEGVIEIYPQQNNLPTSSNLRFGLTVLDMDGVLARANLNGGKVIKRRHQSEWGWRAIIADPVGHRIELTRDQ